MKKAKGGYRAIGLFFCLFSLVSLSAVVMPATAYGQMKLRNLLNAPGCGNSVIDCGDNSNPQRPPQFGSRLFSPWQTVLWWWRDSRNHLPKDVKKAEDQDQLEKFIEKGDRLIARSTPTVWQSVNAVGKQSLMEEIKYWIEHLTPERGRPPKSVGNLRNLQIALQTLPAPAISNSEREKGR